MGSAIPYNRSANEQGGLRIDPSFENFVNDLLLDGLSPPRTDEQKSEVKKTKKYWGLEEFKCLLREHKSPDLESGNSIAARNSASSPAGNRHSSSPKELEVIFKQIEVPRKSMEDHSSSCLH